MNLVLLLLGIFTTLSVVQQSTSLPAEKIAVAYNLHQNVSAHSINELGKDQRIKALLDVQTTIDEVEKLLIADPTLPRLTKGEIRDLFEKVTHDEFDKSISSGDKEKQEFMKNLILALPYHSDEFLQIENLASSKATTMHPIVEPKIPDELKALLKNHGLLTDDDKSIALERLPVLPNSDFPLQGFSKDDSKNNIRIPGIKPESFTSFKNVSLDGKNVSSDIENFLNQFGLLNGNKTDNIKAKKPKNPSSSVKSSFLSPEFLDVLNDMGLQKPKFEALTSSKNSELDPVKALLKSASPSKNEFKRQDSNGKPTKVSFGLNDKPLLESSLESTDDTDLAKTNVVKTTTFKPITTSVTTTELATTTEEEKKNNLEDEIDVVDEPEQLPGPRRSGFYMIFDWNTFLEVGEDPEKIVVRFDPKIGDPTRFLPVNIP